MLLPPDESHHAARVLRLRAGDEVTVTDGAGWLAPGRVGAVTGGRLRVDVAERAEQPSPQPELVVYQGTAKGHKVDGVVQRLAELGVAELFVFSSRRAVPIWDDARLERLQARWAAIARSAGVQSRHADFLRPRAGLSWDEVRDAVGREECGFVLWEEAVEPLRAALTGSPRRVALVVGPEGGFATEEAEGLAQAGARPVSLGPGILRTENAAIVAAAAVLYHYGRIG